VSRLTVMTVWQVAQERTVDGHFGKISVEFP
jgi:hypothetical protein